MRTRNSLIAALAALSLLWVFALPATAADDSWDNGTAAGWMDLGPDWAVPCTDTGQGQPTAMTWNDDFSADQGVYQFRAEVTSTRENAERMSVPPLNWGDLYLCGRVTRDSGGDAVHVAVGAACHAGTVVSPFGGMDSYSGDEGRGRLNYWDPAAPDVQIRNLRWAPTVTGQFLSTADYVTLPEGPNSSTGEFVMLFGGQVGSNTCFPLFGGDGSWWAANTFWAAWELIPTS